MAAAGYSEYSDLRNSSLGTYLKEISKIPLLTREEEIELAIKIRKGDQKALQKLVESNLRFVVTVANRFSGCGLALLDLIKKRSFNMDTTASLANEVFGK